MNYTSPMPPTVLFDGHCGLCSASVQFVLRRDHRALFRFASIQSQTGNALYAAHGLDPANPTTLLLAEEGQIRAKSDAALRIAVLLGWPWKAMGILRGVPRPIRDWAYDFVARHRHRFFPQPQGCWLPQPEWKERFLD